MSTDNNRMLTMAEAVREAMTIAMNERDDVFLMGEDVGVNGGVFRATEGLQKEFGEEIIKLTGTKQKLISKPLPQDDPKQRKPDISIAKEKILWEPVIQLDKGLEETINYFKYNR